MILDVWTRPPAVRGAELEDRLRSILHPRVRRGLGYRAALTMVAVGLLTVVSVSSFRIVAAEPEREPREPRQQLEAELEEKYREARGSNRSFDEIFERAAEAEDEEEMDRRRWQRSLKRLDRMSSGTR